MGTKYCEVFEFKIDVIKNLLLFKAKTQKISEATASYIIISLLVLRFLFLRRVYDSSKFKQNCIFREVHDYMLSIKTRTLDDEQAQKDCYGLRKICFCTLTI